MIRRATTYAAGAPVPFPIAMAIGPTPATPVSGACAESTKNSSAATPSEFALRYGPGRCRSSISGSVVSIRHGCGILVRPQNGVVAPQQRRVLIEALRERNPHQSADGCNSANDNKTGTKVHGGLQPGLSHRV
jgi:hypothetical protein